MDLPQQEFQWRATIQVVTSEFIVGQYEFKYMDILQELSSVGWESVTCGMNKGTAREYSKIQRALTEIDLSSKKFEKCIPVG